MKRTVVLSSLGVLAAAALALALRLPLLGRPPMHGDEANQAFRSGVLFEGGGYRYDPYDHHGPTLYYLTAPSLWLSGAADFAETHEFDYRIVPVVFGAAAVLLVLLLADGMGRPAAVAAAVLMAVSPAMVYYSRYYIQETLLLFFTLGAIGAGWRYMRSGRLGWAMLAGACLGLMHATKETWIISAGAMVAALALVALARRTRPGTPGERPPVRGRHLAAAVATACIVSILLYSSFLANPRGPLDSILAYHGYLARGLGGSLHTHPWHFYLHRLLWFREGGLPPWTEGLIVLLAAVGCAAAATGRGLGRANLPLLRFLAVYTLVTTVAYAALPYKTPWCLLPLLQGMILLAGVGAVALVRWMPRPAFKILVALALAAGTVHLGRQACRAAFRFYADTRNPYVYAHASTDVLRLAERVDGVARVHHDGHNMVIKVIDPGNYWPLPWYLRRFRNVGWWAETPDDPDAPVVIVSPEAAEAVDVKLRHRYQSGIFGLRPGVHLEVRVRQDLWEAFLATRARPRAAE